MILIVNESGVHLTSTLEEFRKFNETIVRFRYALDDAFRTKIPAVEDEESKEHFNTLQDDFAHSLKYMDQGMRDLPCAGRHPANVGSGGI